MIATVESPRISVPTVEQEIEILREAARRLGPLSYAGPWLSQQIDGIERDLRSDMFPQIDLNATRRECAQQIAFAESQAADILKRANNMAKAHWDETNAKIARVRSDMLQSIRQAEKAILS